MIMSSWCFKLTRCRYHAWCHTVREDTSQVVDESPNSDSLVAQSTRRGLRYDWITNWSDSDHVGKSRDDEQDAYSQFSVLAGAAAKTADREKTEEHERQSTHVDGRSADVGEQEPADNSTGDVASGKRDVEVERCDGSKTCSFQKYHAVSQDRITAEDLSCPNDTVLRLSIMMLVQQEGVTYDLGSPKVSATEAIYQSSTFCFYLLLLVGVYDVGQGRLHFSIMSGALVNETMQTAPG